MRGGEKNDGQRLRFSRPWIRLVVFNLHKKERGATRGEDVETCGVVNVPIGLLEGTVEMSHFALVVTPENERAEVEGQDGEGVVETRLVGIVCGREHLVEFVESILILRRRDPALELPNPPTPKLAQLARTVVPLDPDNLARLVPPNHAGRRRPKDTFGGERASL